jgi:hypothetical protein
VQICSRPEIEELTITELLQSEDEQLLKALELLDALPVVNVQNAEHLRDLSVVK